MSDNVLLRMYCILLGGMAVMAHTAHLYSPDTSLLGAVGSVLYIIGGTVVAIWGTSLLRMVVQMADRP